jgi:lipoyl-dependent peroxiredoxin
MSRRTAWLKWTIFTNHNKNQILFMKRSATANWKGSGKEGSGKLLTQSGVIKNKSYDFRSRFEDGTYTNPEELIAAAHAGCFSMKLSFVLGAAGFTPTRITGSHLEVKVKVPKLKAKDFPQYAEDAKANCPISKALNTTITMDAQLVKSFKAATA